MIHLAAIPVFLIAYLLRGVGINYKFKTLKLVSGILMIISIVFFVYTFLAYNGIDLLVIAKNFLNK